MSNRRVTVRVVTKSRVVDAADDGMYQPDLSFFEPPSDSVYLEKLENMFSASTLLGVPGEPTMIASYVYLGTQFQGENIALLKRMRFKNVLNCAGTPDGDSPRRLRAARYKDTGINYEELPLDDKDYTEITGYFGQASSFIESCRSRCENVLIFCSGVSRSGAIALGYLLKSGQTLLKAAQALKEDRRLVCCNSGFLRQLVSYARVLGRLDMEPDACWAPKYMRKLDRFRIRNSFEPDYLRTPYRDLSNPEVEAAKEVKYEGYVRRIPSVF